MPLPHSPKFRFPLFLLALLLIVSSCKKNREAEPLNDAVSSYLYAYTSGTISKASPIRVVFTQAAVGAEEVGSDAPANLISFSPAVEGSATWENENTLLFEPGAHLASKTSYLATVQLGRIFPNAPKEASTFEFNFSTREQFFSVEVEGLQAPDPKDLTQQELTGILRTADLAEAGEVEPVLTAVQAGNKLGIRWSHEGDGQLHRFTVEKIQRGEKPGEVTLSWNGKPLGLDQKGEEKVEIPSLSDFKVLSAQVYQQPQQYIVLNFSDPLDPAQNLQGLIRIQTYAGALKFNIDGNRVYVYPDARIAGTSMVYAEPGIRNTRGARMSDRSEWELTFEEEKPQLRLVGRGVIMPNSKGLLFPFEAINLNAVEVEVFKIYHNNILQFLQTNEFDGNYELERVGRIVLQEKVDLKSLNANASASEWTRYALDLSKLMKQDPNALYQIRLGFRPGYSNYYCGEEATTRPVAQLTSMEQRLDEDGEIESFWGGWYGIDGYYEGYRWEHREDPCYPAYYNYDNFVRRNVFASDLGLIAKRGGDGETVVVVTDLRNANAISGATVELYDYQQQLLGTATTGSDGIARLTSDRKPFVLIAKQGNQTGYLKVTDGNALSLSRFDVTGSAPQKGLKGYLYGERGVWRPGDSLYLHFVLEDEGGTLPANHPIAFEWYDPRGQLQEKRNTAENTSGIYPLHLATAPDAPTGSWQAVVKVGGATFRKSIMIETVKPNRLKIDLQAPGKALYADQEPIPFKLQVNWLHGAPAQNLKARVEVQLQEVNTSFPKYGEYEFDDPARSFYSEPKVVFDGSVDADGKASFQASLLNNNAAPGQLRANIKTRAFEKGGDFSSDQYSLPYHPYRAYVGTRVPRNQYGSKRLEIDEPGKLGFALVDTEGNPLANRKLEVGLYRVNWRWWWDENDGSLSDYSSANHYNADDKTTVTTNSKGEAEWTVTMSDWGRYMVRVCDSQTGHCSGDFFYAGYPWYNDEGFDRQEAAMLAFTSSKSTYNVGETVELKVPGSAQSRILLSLENGSGVLDASWKPGQAGENTLTFKATAEMAPTVYAHVSLLQAHGQTENDLPIRLYGVLPISVVDPSTVLKPKIEMPDVLEPESEVTIQVSETDGRPMAYTVAMVDDGLLDLTRFKTPNPWDHFYAREALGVQTFDVYDYVLGSYGGELERLLSIGGDAAVRPPDQDQTANRFKPVVLHQGPFYLKKGQKAKHTLKIPNYVGSVRTMVVAVQDQAYGAADKTTPVRKPLMVLATLPRVLGPGETLRMPVNVFAMEEGVQNVEVTLSENSGLVDIQGSKTQSLRFSKTGDQLVFFDLRVRENVGVARFKVEAKSGKHQASQEIEIQVRNPNPYITEIQKGTVEKGAKQTFAYEPVGMTGTNSVVLEVSSLPPINLGERLEYLIHYPYGCIEQTLSSGFPQLYVDQVLDLPEKLKAQVPKNVQATVDRLKRFQTSQGGFAYWPGDNEINQWSNTYAGHFLLEARELGYNVPSNMIDRWKKYQKKIAQTWDPAQFEAGLYSRQNDELSQAYRLYTLALAKDPELGAMNRLREQRNLSDVAKWRLAAAYALTGQAEVARQIVQGASMAVADYRELSYTFGSALRDKAMILETLSQMGDKDKAIEMVQVLSEELSGNRWLSTQTIAYSLLAIGKYAGAFDFAKNVAFSYQVAGGAKANAGSERPVLQIELPPDARSVELTNTAGGLLYTQLIRRGQPLVGDQSSAADNLRLEVVYKTTDGRVVDPGQLAQGTDFLAEVTVTHPGAPYSFYYEEMALDQIFPSGWEILNTRMDNLELFNNTARPEYEDIRDDRVYTFFDIGAGRSQTYRVRLNAAYQGRYYLPSVSCAAMYDHRIHAHQPGRWVEVVSPQLN